MCTHLSRRIVQLKREFCDDILFTIYHRMGFKCEHVIIATCDFSPSAQSLERNVYITHSINQYVACACA